MSTGSCRDPLVALAKFGAAALAGAIALGPLVAGHVAIWFSGNGWPRRVETSLLAETLGSWRDLIESDGGTGWVMAPGRSMPGPWWMWLVTSVTWTMLAVGGVGAGLVAARLHRGGGSKRLVRAGLATAAEESEKVTGAALVKRAGTLRPALARSTPVKQIRPAQLGNYLGRSVATRQGIWRPIESSTIVTGLTESGKTSAVIIPAVLDWDGRQLVSTTKTDILAATWTASMDRGGVRVFDPLGLTGRAFETLKYTPISGCDDPEIAENRTKVLTFRSASGPDPNADFRADGQRVVRALLHAAALADLPLSELLGWVYNPLDARPEQIIRGSGRGHHLYAEELASVRRSPDKQREGSYLSVRAAFDGMSSPRALAAIDWRPSTAFHPARWLAQGSESLYLMTHRTQMPGATKVVTLMVSDVLEAARLHAVASVGSRMDPPVPIIADEALNTCRLPDWETVLSDSRGWGIPITMVAQSRAMIRSAYGRDEGEGIWEAAGTRIMVGGGAGGSDTRELAEAFGRHDVATLSTELHGSGGTVSQRREEVRTVADLRNLPPGRAIVLAAQTPPIEVALRPWWERSDAAAVEQSRTLYESRRSGNSTATSVTWT